MARTVSPVQELRLAGSSRDKVLSLRLSVWRRCRLPMLAGMPPVRLLELRSRVLRKDRLPMAGERTPVSSREGRLSATTSWWRPPHVTPSQPQNVPVVLLLFHQARALVLP
jgi:hypothetical protein